MCIFVYESVSGTSFKLVTPGTRLCRPVQSKKVTEQSSEVRELLNIQEHSF